LELPDYGLSALLDPLAVREALLDVGGRLARNPRQALAAGARFGFGLAEAAAAAAAKALGAEAAGPTAVDPDDRRFADPTWTENPVFFGLLQSYLLSARLLRDLVAAAGPNGAQTEKAAFAIEQVISALAPTNFLATNPAALKRAFETGGASVRRGASRFVDDVAATGGMPRQVDADAFTVGTDLAATPGKVVYRNRLIELIQYAPQTDTVFEVPILFVPPWINKYYVMDLAPGKSFAEWGVQHGHTVFCISYRNPDESLRGVGLQEYLLEAPLAALEALSEITGSPQANVVGFCLGGTLTTMLLAHLAALGEERVRSATLLNTLVDFEETGILGSLVDRAAVERLERRMEKRGYLEGGEMAKTFSLLRANDLVWRYVASSWLMGEDPPAFDILAWNADSTRMPAAMHSQYLRSCYVENALASGALELNGTPLKLGDIRAPLYVLTARDDHIAPWKSCYRTTQLVGGDVRFVLSSSGHIAGVVNPPNPKRSYWTGEALLADPGTWLGGAEQHAGSWWEDWAVWVETHAGERREPPPLGSEAHPPLADAPGSYVHEK
jgi:polyhydroxyalkanoate synthase